MTKSEFEEFYEYITRFNIIEDEGECGGNIKETYWKSLQDTPFKKAVSKAKETYKMLLISCNLNQLNPKVFSGENPNPGLFGRQEKETSFYN